MPNGYLVTLGDGVLDSGDVISGALITFTTSQTLGNGSWVWSGNWTGNGNYYSNISDTGTYFLATDGNTYFVPTNWTVDPIDTATVAQVPQIDGTDSGDVIDDTFVDADGDGLVSGGNRINSGEGDDTILTNGAVDGSNDIIDAGSGNDTVNAGGGNDTILGQGGADILDGGAGEDNIDGGAGNDTIDGGDGADVITGGAGDDNIAGGDADDIIYGEGSTAGIVQGQMQWTNEGPANTDLSGGFTQDANGIEVTVNVNDLGGLIGSIVSNTPQYVGTEDFDGGSALQITGSSNGGAGVSSTVEVEFNFAAAIDSGLNDSVENVQFRINDIDQVSWDDYVTVLAFDSAGGAVPVTLQLDGDETMLDADTINGAGNDQPGQIGGSVLVTVDGPVTRIEVIYENAGNDDQALWITDVHFDATPAATSSNDTISGDAGDDTVYAGEGDDTVYGGADDDTLNGEDGNDTIFGEDGDDTIDGGAGNDVLYGDAGSINLIYNGSFEDLTGTVETSWGDQGVGSVAGWTDYDPSAELDLHEDGKGGTYATDGTHVLDMGASPQNLHVYQDVAGVVTGEDYTLTLDAGDLSGVDNNALEIYWNGVLVDTINPGAGTMDSFSYALVGGSGDGSNRLEFKEVGVIDVHGLQLDNIQLFSTPSATDGNGADDITGGTGDDIIYAGAGNDVVTGGADNDTVFLGEGDDIFGDWTTDDGDDTIFGEGGNDTINAGNGDDFVSGGDGDDTLIGASGDDFIEGGFGDDDILITDDHESDVIEGGEDPDGLDFDQAIFSNFASTDGVTVTYTGAEAGTYDFDSTDADGSFVEIEQIGTTSGDDTIDGTANTTGIDVFTNAGDDTVDGGSGDDIVNLGSGEDVVDAGQGDDYVDLGSNGSGSPDGDADLVMVSDGDGNDTLANFDAPTPNGDGTFTGIDGIDVSDLTDADGNPVNTADISVSTDGSGNAVWTFPGGETLTFVGLTEAQVGSPAQMVAMGVPSDGIVSGDASGNVINGTYAGDPDHDMVDNNDAILPGEVGNDDIIEAGGGSDIVLAGDGNDEIFGDIGVSTGLDQSLQGAVGTSGTLTGTNGQTDTTFAVTSGTGAVDQATYSSVVDGYWVANMGDGGSENETYSHTFSQEVAGAELSITAGNPNEEFQLVLDGAVINLTEALAEGLVSFDGAGSYEINADGHIVLASGGSSLDVATLTIHQPFTTMDVTGLSTDGNNISGWVYGLEIDTNPPVVQGNDTIDGGDDSDVIAGHGGDDDIEGGAGDDTVYGGTGNDDIQGNSGDDALYGGAGDDTFLFEAGFGTDTVTGGEDGESSLGDTIEGAYSSDLEVTMSGDEAGQMTDGANTVTFEEIERIVTDAGDDTVNLTGDTSGMEVETGSGTDTVTSGGGNDTINTQDGSDTVVLNEGFGVDTIDGGSVDDLSGDTLDASNMTSDVTVVYSFVEDGTLTQGSNSATFADMENLITGSGDDYIDGTLDSLGVDVFSGAGNDTLIGGSGIDEFDAGDGDDLFLINNNFGNDSLRGGEGAETIGDRLDASNVTENLVLDLTNFDANNPENGTLGNGSDELMFSQIESFTLGSGDDSATGSTGADTIDMGSGEDVVEGGEGDDQINLGDNGAGAPDGDNDTLVFSDGDGDDIVTNFDAPTDNGDGTFTGIDLLDVSGLTSDGSTPVHTGDVTVTDDGSGNAVLNFPGGESITLIGVAPAEVSDRMALLAIGIPSDGIVSGTAAGETINTSYAGDPDGDYVDNGDAILPGETGDDDIIEAGGGDDNILAGLGDDEIYGEAGDDTIQLDTNFGDDTIVGGETGETNGDRVIASSLTEDLTVTFDGNEQGTISGTSGDADFEEIEEIHTGSGDDTIDASLDGVGTTILAGAGIDDVTGGSGADTIFGQDGNDTIDGGAGDDALDGGNNDDILTGGAGEDTLIGGAGSDDLDGGTEDDTLFGGAGDDTLTGGAGSDNLYGGDDADTFYGGIGDTVVGGEGGTDNDVLDVTGAGSTRVIYDAGDPESGTIEFIDGTGAVIGTLDFSEIETVNSVPCFTAQSRIATPSGDVPIADLKVGDLVLTRDSGFKPIKWIGSTKVDAIGNRAPIEFAKGALGENNTLLVSPQHRVLLTGWKAEILFGSAEVLAPAVSLINGRTIKAKPGGTVSYYHMMFDRHEIVLSDKAWTESFHPGDVVMGSMADAARDEILELFPALSDGVKTYGDTARPVIKPREALAFTQDNPRYQMS
ncbi:Hint domain-containing protein [Algirhabdus cladophorae]|uniref:Hint domain-containing protein n=1 Tax=Algirhabdus cladophorae TaxID=3377108 RepID=UPI003B849A47